MKKSKHTVLKYTLVGIVFGFMFPIGALAFEFIVKEYPSVSLSSIYLAHKNNRILYMVDSAPLFLGLFALWGGIYRKSSENLSFKLHQLLENLKAETEQAFVNTKEISNNIIVINENNKENFQRVKSVPQQISAMIETLNNIRDIFIERIEKTHKAVEGIKSFYISVYSIFEKIQSNTQESDKSMMILEDNFDNSKNSIDIMKSVDHSMSKIEVEIAEINTELREMNQMIMSIEDISTEVHRLSINSKIESAKAGEFGNGFMVIANEISILAGTTKVNTDKLQKKMANIMREFEIFTMNMNQNKEDLSTGQSLLNNLNENLIPVIDATLKIRKSNNESITDLQSNIHTLSTLTVEIESVSSSCNELIDTLKKQNEDNADLMNAEKYIQSSLDSIANASEDFSKHAVEFAGITDKLYQLASDTNIE